MTYGHPVAYLVGGGGGGGGPKPPPKKAPFQRPIFQNIFGRACPRTPLQLRRHYGLPFTKILATQLQAHLPYDGATYIAYTQNNGQFNALNKCFIHINTTNLHWLTMITTDGVVAIAFIHKHFTSCFIRIKAFIKNVRQFNILFSAFKLAFPISLYWIIF